MKTKHQILITTLLIMISTFPTMAQGGAPATPIDGGLSFLIALGAGYGVKKLIRNKSK